MRTVLFTVALLCLTIVTADAQPAGPSEPNWWRPKAPSAPAPPEKRSSPSLELGGYFDVASMFGDGALGFKVARQQTRRLYREISYDKSTSADFPSYRILVADLRVQTETFGNGKRVFATGGIALANGMQALWSPMISFGALREIQEEDFVTVIRAEIQRFPRGFERMRGTRIVFGVSIGH